MAIHSGFSQQIWWFSIVMLILPEGSAMPLIIWSFHIALDNHQFLVDFPMKKGHAHIAMLVYQRGIICRGVLQFPWLGRTWGLPRTLRTYRKKFKDGWTSWPEPGNKDQKRIQHLWVDMGYIIGRYRDFLHSWDDFHGPRRKGPGSQP